MTTRSTLVLSSVLLALGIAAACTPAEMAAVNKIDPVVHPKDCPLQCGPTAGHPTGDMCCWLGTDGSGYTCNSALDKSPNVCTFTAQGIGPADPYGAKARPDAGDDDAGTPSPTEPPKAVLEVTRHGKG